MKSPVRIAVTGAAGQIGYALLFRIAAGEMLGKDQPVILQLLEVTPAMKALEGVVMELDDCAYSTLAGVETSDDANTAFKDADYVYMVGAKPRGPGMERNDLLEANAAIFSGQGKALNDNANRNVKVIVVGNPANTNALITMKNAPDINPANITAMMRLDHNRALAQLATRTGVSVIDIRKLCIWGNHSTTQFPDIHHAIVGDKPAIEMVDNDWYENEYIPTVAKRGAAIIDARGASSAASAANAALEHMRDWVNGSASDNWVSMAVPSDGSYGIPQGLIFSYPVECSGGEYSIVQGLEINEFSQSKIDATKKELEEERDAIAHLLS